MYLRRLSDDFLLHAYKTNDSISNWNVDDGYSSNDKLDTYPRRGFVAGMLSGFTALVQLFEKDFDYICRSSTQGFQVRTNFQSQIQLNVIFLHQGEVT